MTIRAMSKSDHHLDGTLELKCGEITLDIRPTGTNTELTWCAKPWVLKRAFLGGQERTAHPVTRILRHATTNITQHSLIVLALKAACLNAQLHSIHITATPTLQQSIVTKIHKSFSEIESIGS